MEVVGTTPYGLPPTGTFVAVSAVKSSTRMLFDPGFAEYPVVPETARYAGKVSVPFTTLAVDTGGFCVKSNTKVLPFRASFTYNRCPFDEAASPLGALNDDPVAGTANDDTTGTASVGSNTLTELELRFATYTDPLTSTTPVGRVPTVTVFVTAFVAVSITLTVPPPKLAAYRRAPFALNAAESGCVPTVTFGSNSALAIGGAFRERREAASRRANGRAAGPARKERPLSAA